MVSDRNGLLLLAPQGRGQAGLEFLRVRPDRGEPCGQLDDTSRDDGSSDLGAVSAWSAVGRHSLDSIVERLVSASSRDRIVRIDRSLPRAPVANVVATLLLADATLPTAPHPILVFF
ncbi:MAG: hypothetical protein KDB80_01230 [Planctomycetes bacterium]|nr:hypothetical protein [Planctomycetota bacterium]